MKSLRYPRWMPDVVVWAGLYALWIVVFQNRTIVLSHTMGIQFCYLVFIAMNFYITSYVLFPRFFNRKRFALFIFFSLLLVAVSSLMRAEVAVYINRYIFKTPVPQGGFLKLYLNSLLNIFFWTETMITGKIIIDKIKFQRYTEALEKERIINELNFLRAQNNPHFLFNSLNSIYFQINKTNRDARETLMRLSEMLRYQLYECSSEKVLVEREIHYLTNYIELQKLRLNSNYSIDLSIMDNIKNFEIAPLLIMPLIENAFKYVSHFNDKKNEIAIELSITDNVFKCSIWNTIEKTPADPPAMEGGIGLKNLKRRLELLYPYKHQLLLENDETHYSVNLKINIDEN